MDDVTDIYREYGDSRLPPGQRETDEFPVLSKSGTPSWTRETWSFDVWGAVDDECRFDFESFRALPSTTQKQDFHCVTGWSTLGRAFTGVPFRTIAERAGVNDDAVHVMFHALDGYTTDLPLSDCLHDGVLFAYELADRLGGTGVTSTAVHPGFVPESRIWRHASLPVRAAVRIADLLPGVGTDVATSGRRVAALASSPDVADVTGQYFDGTDPAQPSPAALDESLRARLWAWSADAVGVDPELSIS